MDTHNGNINAENGTTALGEETGTENGIFKPRVQDCVKNVGYEWCNELLSFPSMFNGAFVSLYKCNEYIDNKWLLMEESYSRLTELLFEMSKEAAATDGAVGPNGLVETDVKTDSAETRGETITIKEVTLNKDNVEYRLSGRQVAQNEVVRENSLGISNGNSCGEQKECSLPCYTSSCDNIKQLSKQTYHDIFNKYQTCINDIDITFEKKEEILIELKARLSKIISSIELFMKNNPGVLESNVRPMYNICNTELVDKNMFRKKTGRGRPPGSTTRGRPPGSGNRGRPPGSTNGSNSTANTKKKLSKRSGNYS